MAIQTEGHREGFFLPHFRGVIDVAVTLHATDAAIHMDGVIEINVVGRLMNLNPWNRLAVQRALADELELGAVLQNLVVTIHACRRRRHV